MENQNLNKQNNLSGLNEKTGNYKSKTVTWEQFREELQKMLLTGHAISMDLFPEQVIKEQFERDSRPGLAVLFLRNKFGLKEKVKTSNKFGDNSAGSNTKEIL